MLQRNAKRRKLVLILLLEVFFTQITNIAFLNFCLVFVNRYFYVPSQKNQKHFWSLCFVHYTWQTLLCSFIFLELNTKKSKNIFLVFSVCLTVSPPFFLLIMGCTEIYVILGSQGAAEDWSAEVTAIIMDHGGMICVDWIFISNAPVTF